MPQGTIKTFDETTKTATILLDSQEELPVDAETFAASGLLELRMGQRVRFDLDGTGDARRVRGLTLVSF
jgi:cold shock CspA family protein